MLLDFVRGSSSHFRPSPRSTSAPALEEAQKAAVVHDTYDLDDPPTHPGNGWTRFVCISDNHSDLCRVPDGDVLLHAGDLTKHGTWKDLDITLQWLKSLPHRAKFVIAGNHDLCLDAQYKENGSLRPIKPRRLDDKDITTAQTRIRSRATRKAGITYLEYQSATYTARSGRTYTIYGSPAAPFYSLGAFQYADSGAQVVCDQIPAGTHILMTHTPPLGICDLTKRNKNAGCPVLAERLTRDDLKSCRLHVFGHIHEARGATLIGQSEDTPCRVSVNASLPALQLPIIVDLQD
ncbi:Metallo-dependent phosphatase [Epithele typhae]|uniref:Metallo-dependent phosphatase n=1 Tax=Epithele typhae TaxID=378194 RepID=UPI002008B120|nr:Metallo-dependent phosphatase [Epithele typhae]KAH9931715.1 Metallo-dependent phosphatase [Epithele typhae]